MMYKYSTCYEPPVETVSANQLLYQLPLTFMFYHDIARLSLILVSCFLFLVLILTVILDWPYDECSIHSYGDKEQFMW